MKPNTPRAGRSWATSSISALTDGIKKAGSTNSDAVAKALLGLTFDTPIGQRTFNDNTHETDMGEFWGEMVKDDRLPVRRHEEPQIPRSGTVHELTARTSGWQRDVRTRTARSRRDASALRRELCEGVAMFEVSFLFGQFLGGLTTAMFLFLIASGLSLVFGVMRVLNFAHGSFYMIGAYLAWQVVAVARACTATASGWRRSPQRRAWLCSAGIVERLLLRHLYGREELYQLLLHLRAGADPG